MKKLNRIISIFLTLTFTTTQILWSADYQISNQGSYQPVKTIEEIPAHPAENEFSAETTQAFLSSDLPLSALSEEVSLPPARGLGGKEKGGTAFPADSHTASPLKKGEETFLNKPQAYDYERYEFDAAQELLRPEFASAVIVKNLTEENLKALTDLSFEVAILALKGEIVLVTSGSEDEIGVLPAVRQLIDEASFISHIHPGQYSKEGPSGQDINEAVAAPGREYVITHKGVYAYNNEGLLNDGNLFSYEQYLTQLRQAVAASALEGDQVDARKVLNAFIAEQDRYNHASEEEKETFRRGGTLSYTAGLTASSVSSLTGRPLPYITAGSTAAVSLAVNSNQFSLNYSVPAAGNISGFTISYDNASTAVIETQNISTQVNLTFGLRGPNTAATFEIIDINGNKDTFILTGLSTTERFWRIPVASIASTLDKTRVKQINFIVNQSNTASAARTGTLFVRVNGVNVTAPAPAVVSTTIPAAVNTSAFVLSGTKEANTAVLINGVVVIPANASTNWTAAVSLPVEGNNTFTLTSKNMIGKTSATKSVTIRKDTIVPKGSINISSGAAYTANQIVTLNLSGSDSGSGVSAMSFSADGANWSASEPYAASKIYSLPAGDGVKTVYVRYYDKAGNASLVYSKSITLDTLVPTGTVKVNSGATAVNQTAITLNLTATDASGISKMSFSTNNSTWTAAENFAAAKTYTVTSGDGNKTVYVRFQDNSGKWSLGIPVTVLLDTVRPTGSININSGAIYTSSAGVTLNLAGTDAASGIHTVSFSTDNVNWSAAEAYSAAKTFQLPAGEGSKTVYVRYYDKAGNVSLIYSKSILLDTAPPEGSVNINSGAAITGDSTVTLNLSASDSNSGIDKMSFSDDGIHWTAAENYAATKTYALTAGDGGKTVSVKFYDKAGNASEVYSKSILLDTEAPSGSIEINSGKAYASSFSAVLHLPASDAGSGLDKMSFSIDGISWTGPEDYAVSKTYTLPPGDGNKTVYVKYYDKAGKASGIYSKTILVDTVSPTGSFTINSGGSHTNSALVSLNLTAEDAASGLDKMSFSADGTNWTNPENYAVLKSFPLSSGDGGKTIYVRFYDKAGNAGPVLSKNILLDTIPPTGNFKINENASYANQTAVSLSLAAEDPSGLGQMQFSTDEGNTWTSNEDFQPLKMFSLPAGDGNKKILWRITDSAGNTSAFEKSILLDTSGPAGAIIINQGEEQTHSRNIHVKLTGTDSGSGMGQMRFSPDGGLRWTEWENFKSEKTLELPEEEGVREVIYEIRDQAGNISQYKDSISYQRNWREILEDGTALIYTAGILSEEITPSGHHAFYNPDGSLASYRGASGEEIQYLKTPDNAIRILSGEGELLETITKPSVSELDLTAALKVAFAGGLEGYYQNGVPAEFRTASGIRVTDFDLSETGEMTKALFVYPDGTLEVIRLGALLRRISPDGTVQDFTPAGFSVREISPSGRIQYFSYEKQSQTQTSAIRIFAEDGSSSRYDELGILREIKTADNQKYIYDRSGEPENLTTTLNVSSSSQPSPQTMVSGVYSKTGQLQKVIFKDGREVEIIEGEISQVKDSSGNRIQYSYEETDGILQGLKVNRDGNLFHYDASGFLKSIQTASGEILREKQDANLDGALTDEDIVRLLLETTGGDSLSDFELDSEGKILKGILKTKDGVKQRIENGMLAGFETVDGKIYDVQENEAILKEWHFQNGTRILYGGGTISEILFADGKRLHTIGFSSDRAVESFSEELPDGTKKEFSNRYTSGNQFKLIKLTTPSGARIEYGADGLAERVLLPDARSQRLEYAYGSDGKVMQIVFTELNSNGQTVARRVYDSEGNLEAVLENGVSAEMTDGQISRLFTQFGEINQPQWNTQGLLSGETQFIDGTRVAVQNGEVTKMVRPTGTAVYYSQGRAAAIETEAGRFTLLNPAEDGLLDGPQIRWEKEGENQEMPLVPALLDPALFYSSAAAENPLKQKLLRSFEEMKSILLSVPLNNLFDERSEIASEFNGEDVLFLTKWAGDNERQNAFELGGYFSPKFNVANDLAAGKTINRFYYMDSSNAWYSSKISELIDIDGNGLQDRVSVTQYAEDGFWWVEFNYGNGFESPVKWTGVDRHFENYPSSRGALSFYASGYTPAMIGDLVDMNGDGRPDRIMQKTSANGQWLVQINNGHGFDAAVNWAANIQALAYGYPEAMYALEVRDYAANYELISDLIDLDGDDLPDRVLRPSIAPYDRWFFQKNTGTGFADAVLWEGVDASWMGDAAAASGLSRYQSTYNNYYAPAVSELSNWLTQYAKATTSTARKTLESALYTILNKYQIFAFRNNPPFPVYNDVVHWVVEVRDVLLPKISADVADVSELLDMNGDGRPDRVFLKNGNKDWYVQFNNGEGFDAAQLWDSNVRQLPLVQNDSAGYGIRLFQGWNFAKNILIDLKDVTGDGLPDRITVGQYQFSGAQNTWYVEVNNGHGFDPAAAWTGIYGTSAEETAITQASERFQQWNYLQQNKAKMSDLKDINGDQIADRIIYSAGQNRWLVQYGTGHGFLPAQDLQITALETSGDFSAANYDYVHVSLKAQTALPASAGKVRVSIGNPDNPAAFQEWAVTNLDTAWKDFYLPIDKTKSAAGELKIVYEAVGANAPVPVYVNDVTFAGFRPPASKDWLDRMLVEENILSAINSGRNETLTQYLGLKDAESSLPVDFNGLLQAETRIKFDEQGQAEEFQTLYGSVSKMENGRVVETLMPDGTKIEFNTPNLSQSQTAVQTVQNSDGTAQALQLSYGRVRSVARPGKSALEYSYEFDAQGTEITVVRDPDTEITERYKENKLIARTLANGVLTQFEYDAQGGLKHSAVSYKGRIYETFDHSVLQGGEETHQVVMTQNGTKEEYSSEGTILFHTTADGYRYQHQFEKARKVVTSQETKTIELPDGTSVQVQVPSVILQDDPQGEQIHQVVLKGYQTASGEEAQYEKAALKSLRLSSGTKIHFDRAEIKKITQTNGELKEENVLSDATVFHPDGTITEFRGGLPYSVTSAGGHSVLLVDGNPNESAVFHAAQAQKLWQETIQPKWKAFQAAADFTVQIEYDSGGKMVTREFPDGTRELYTDGKISQVISKEGEPLIEYDYDVEGNPIRIELAGTRRNLNSAVLKLQAEVAMEREKALAFVAERQQVVNQTIEGQYAITRDRLLAIRAEIEAQQDKVGSISVKGKSAKGILAGAMNQIQAGMDQVNQALAKLANDRADALAKLNQQVAEANIQIQAETNASYAKIDAENQAARTAILKQEASPVIYHWYRKILGRDPSQAEYDVIIPTINFSQMETGNQIPGWLLDLKTNLLNSSELAQRSAQVENIKNLVEAELRSYLALSRTDREVFARQWGIGTEELISLSAKEADSILIWLKAQSLHFGQSAYIALETLLRDAGKSFDREQLAARLILIDILTGTLTPFEAGDLVISIYAMNLVAAAYGLQTNGYKMNYEALKSLYAEACAAQNATLCNFHLIAHINGNHYVLITKVTDTEVAYIDPGLGPENALQIQTLTKDAFLKTWIDPEKPLEGFGYLISPRAPPASFSSNQVQTLTVGEQMRVRGAFFAFLIPFFIAIATAVANTVAAAISAVGVLLGSLVSGIGSILTGFGQMAAGLFTGSFTAGLQAGFASILNGISLIGTGFEASFNMVSWAIFGGIQGIAGSIPFFGPALSGITSSSAFAGAFNLGFAGMTIEGSGILLEKVGISPKFTSTIIAGGKMITGLGLLAAGNPIGLAASLSLLGSGTSEFLALHTNLSPVLTNVLSIGAMALGSFAGGGINTGSLSGAIAGLKSSLPYLSMDLASVGVSGLGSSLGLSWRITALISVPVMASVGGLVNGLGNGSGASSIFNSIKDSLLSSEALGGLVSVGASIGLDAIGAPPLLQSFIPGILGQLAGSATGSTGDGGGPGDPTPQQQGQNIFNRIGDNLVKFGRSIVNTASNVISFGQKIFEGGINVVRQGLAKTADLFSNMFNRKTIENMSAGGQTTIEQSILTSGNFSQNGDLFTWETQFGGETVSISHFGNGQYVIQEGNQTKTFTQMLTDGFGTLGSAGITIADKLADGIITQYEITSKGLETIEVLKDGTKVFEIDGSNADGIDLQRDLRTQDGLRIYDAILGTIYKIKQDGDVDVDFEKIDFQKISSSTNENIPLLDRIGLAMASVGEFSLDQLGDFALAGLMSPMLATIDQANQQDVTAVKATAKFLSDTRSFFNDLMSPSNVVFATTPEYQIVDNQGVVQSTGQVDAFHGRLSFEKDLELGTAISKVEMGVANFEGEVIAGNENLNLILGGGLDVTQARFEAGFENFIAKVEAFVSTLDGSLNAGTTVGPIRVDVEATGSLGAFGIDFEGGINNNTAVLTLKIAMGVGGGISIKFTRNGDFFIDPLDEE